MFACTAAFSINVNNMTAVFNDNSSYGLTGSQTGDAIFQYGDGNVGSNPYHTYATAGTYTVLMTINVYDSSIIPATIVCTDTVSHTVTIGNVTPTNTISGWVFADTINSNFTGNYKVWLIKLDSMNYLHAVDSVSMTLYNYASYHFDNKPAGSYRVKAAITGQPAGTAGFVPTYHDSSLYWLTAAVINHTGGSSTNNNVWMRTGTVTSGPGFIGGNVTTGANKSANKTTSNPCVGLLVYLINSTTNQLVGSSVTDASGNYSFSNLPVGNYKVSPEEMNFTTTSWTNIAITTAQPSAASINFAEHTVSFTITPITTGVATVANNIHINVYPNPSNTGNINIAIGSVASAQVTVTNIAGQIVHNATMTADANGVITLDVAALQAGTYFVTVDANNMHTAQQVVLTK
jgi:hypothetical protein